jgi:hypothetical protein
MGIQSFVPPGSPLTVKDLSDAYSDLLDDLNDAYWAASSIDTKDQIYGMIEAVGGIISELDSADLNSRDAAYGVLVTNIASLNKQLEALQKGINSLISRINTSASVISDITKILSVAAKIIPVG